MWYPNKKRLYKGQLCREFPYFNDFIYHAEFIKINLSFRPSQHREHWKIT